MNYEGLLDSLLGFSPNGEEFDYDKNLEWLMSTKFGGKITLHEALHSGLHVLMRFESVGEVSIIKHRGSYGGVDDLWEAWAVEVEVDPVGFLDDNGLLEYLDSLDNFEKEEGGK